jgi:hypothetical protein
MPDHAIAHVEGVVTDPSMRFIRRPEAARYLKDKYGFGASRTLAKGVVTGDTPVFHKAGRIVLYTREALDAWALAKISGPLKSSSEAAAASRRPAGPHSSPPRACRSLGVGARDREAEWSPSP